MSVSRLRLFRGLDSELVCDFMLCSIEQILHQRTLQRSRIIVLRFGSRGLGLSGNLLGIIQANASCCPPAKIAAVERE